MSKLERVKKLESELERWIKFPGLMQEEIATACYLQGDAILYENGDITYASIYKHREGELCIKLYEAYHDDIAQQLLSDEELREVSEYEDPFYVFDMEDEFEDLVKEDLKKGWDYYVQKWKDEIEELAEAIEKAESI